MAISYKRLWKLLIDREMKKKDLVGAAGSVGLQLLKWATMNT